MNSFTRSIIEYVGIDTDYVGNCSSNCTSCFKQTMINLKLCVPTYKPKIEQVIKVKVEKKVVKHKFVETPRGVSSEGQVLTGCKVLVIADLFLKINYVALQETQTVHSFHVVIPFCESVAMSEGYDKKCGVFPVIHLEDIYVEQCSPDSLYGSLSLITKIEPAI